MAHTYYKQELPNGTIELSSIWDSENGIAIHIKDGTGSAYIGLMEKDVDELISGMLERRGVPKELTEMFIEDMRGSHMVAGKSIYPISATGTEKSRIHPPKE